MILLTNSIISKIERLRRYEKISCIFRFVFLIGIVFFTFLALYSNQYDYYSFVIICMLISTYAINWITDTLNGDLELLLDIIEYERCKKTHEQ